MRLERLYLVPRLLVMAFLFAAPPLAQAQPQTPVYTIGSETAEIPVDIVLTPVCEGCWNLTRVLSDSAGFQALIEDGTVVVHIYPVYLTRYDLWLDMFARCSASSPWPVLEAAMLDETLWSNLADFSDPAQVIARIRAFYVPDYLSNDAFVTCSQNSDLAKALVNNGVQVQSRFAVERTPLLLIAGRRAEGDGQAVVVLYEELTEKRGMDVYDMVDHLRRIREASE